MALSPTSKSTTVYLSAAASKEESNKPKIGEAVLAAIDNIVEYPGSKKGDFGHWVLMEWVDSKIKAMVERNGQERR